METSQGGRERAPGGGLACGELAGGERAPIGPLMADTLGDILDLAALLERMIAQLCGARAETIERARLWSVTTQNATSFAGSAAASAQMARRVLVSELACALRISERAADTLVAESASLVNDLPATMTALCAGEIGYRHAQTMVDNVATLTDADRAELEQQALPAAAESTPAAFERRVRALRDNIDPGAAVARHSRALADRRVDCTGGRDGMAWLSVYLPAVEAVAIFSRLTDAARVLQTTDEARDLDQLRADLAGQALLDGSEHGSRDDLGDLATLRRIRPKVLVTVPVLTLLGRGDGPAILDGYGPIDPATARHLVAGAPSLTRLLTHPETGAVLSVGRRKYRVSADLRAWLRVRDGTCRFPGCGRNAAGCDLDHTVDWYNGGATAWHNLAHLCPKHHRLKHEGGWSVTQTNAGPDAGELIWTAPSGRSYRTAPAVRMARPSP